MTISENDVSGNGTGIACSMFSSVLVSHNIVNGNTGAGVGIIGGVGITGGTATVQNNIVNGNGVDGISIDPNFPGSAEVINNTSLANGNFDLFDPTPDCSGHVWSANTFFTANRSCIH